MTQALSTYLASPNPTAAIRKHGKDQRCTLCSKTWMVLADRCGGSQETMICKAVFKTSSGVRRRRMTHPTSTPWGRAGHHRRDRPRHHQLLHPIARRNLAVAGARGRDAEAAAGVRPVRREAVRPRTLVRGGLRLEQLSHWRFRSSSRRTPRKRARYAQRTSPSCTNR